MFEPGQYILLFCTPTTNFFVIQYNNIMLLRILLPITSCRDWSLGISSTSVSDRFLEGQKLSGFHPREWIRASVRGEMDIYFDSRNATRKSIL